MPPEDLRRIRYSTLYEVPDEPSRDSPLLRKRLARKVCQFLDRDSIVRVAEHVEDELGLDIGPYASRTYEWEKAFRDARIGQLLSALTEIQRSMIGSRRQFNQSTYRSEINRIFQEEAVGYYLDEDAVAHPKPDEAYRTDFSRTISKLGSIGLEAAVAEIEKADRHILEDTQDWARAIYAVFKACENIFKATIALEQSPPRLSLSGYQVDRFLVPVLEARLQGEPEVVKEFLIGLLASFKSWVDACHKYRHADDQTQPHQPPEELALVAVTNGYGFARWLADIYVYQRSQQLA